MDPERITRLRERLGLTQEQLEDLLGLGRKVVTRWENGKVALGGATECLLLLLERRPELLSDLRSIRGSSRRQP